MGKIVSDGIYMFLWVRDNLSQEIMEFNMKNEGRLIVKGTEVGSNGFIQYGLGFNGVGYKLLEQFCSENDVELVKVPALSVDTHSNLNKLMKAAGIIGMNVKPLNKCPVCMNKLVYANFMQFTEEHELKRNGEPAIKSKKSDVCPMEQGYIYCTNNRCGFATDCDLKVTDAAYASIHIFQKDGAFFYYKK